MKTVLQLLTALLMLTGTLFAQSPPCGVDSLQEHYSQTNPHYHAEQNAFIERINEFRQNSPTQPYFGPGDPSTSLSLGCRTTRYIIPVVVHIDEVDSTIQVSDTQVYQQIQILNDVFAPYQIQFCLAKKTPDGLNFNGINRMTSTFNPASPELIYQLPELTAKDYFNPAKYLNIYVVKDIQEGGNPSGLLGYNGSFAGNTSTDAIVIRHNYFGDYTSCANCGTLASGSRGKILVHEIGHYLGLRHTFRGSCLGGNNASSCSYEGDLCCDTRPVLSPGNTCSIDTSYRSCLTYHLAIPENRTNYMDYSGEACMDNFTPDQVSIMHATLEIFRSGLIHTENVNYLAANCCAGSAWFDADNDVVCLGDSVWLSSYEYNSTVNYHWVFYRSGETQPFLDTILTNPRWFYIAADTNTFDISLKITSVLGDTVGISRLNFLTIKDCGSLLTSTQGSWYFGNHAGLRFTTAGVIKDIRPSQDDPNNIYSSEGTVSVCDSAGNLLFYGGPRLPRTWDLSSWKFEFPLFNRDYLPMQGGRIMGDPSASQGGIVIPIPGHDTRYYVISTCGSTDASVVFPDSAGLRYSVVDMTLNSGLGDIDPAAVNIPVPAPSGSRFNTNDSAFFSGEFLTAIPKCGSEDYWLITNDASGSGYANFNKLIIYSVSSTGITHHATTSIVLNDNGGQLKASPDGSWLASPSNIMKFDQILGVITLYRTMPIEHTWGMSFSPDSRKLYAFDNFFGFSKLWQFDMESSDSMLSGVIITANYPRVNNHMQLGPDNKLYLARVFDPRVGVINSPDSLCNPVQNNKCDFQVDGPYTQSNGHGGTNYDGFPNMIDAKQDVEPDFTMVDSGCGTVKFRPNNSCAFSYLWDFGDGSPTSSETEPTHVYSTKDSFEITLTINGLSQVKRKIGIGIPRPEIVGDTTVCDTSINAYYSVNSPNSFFRYTWFSNDADLFPDLSNPHGTRAEWHQNGSLIVKAEYDKNGCFDFDTVEVRFNLLDSNVISISATSCFSGEPLLITGNAVNSTLGAVSYSWQVSTDSSVWNPTSSADTSQNFNSVVPGTTSWYRRRATKENCSLLSLPVKTITMVKIVKNLGNILYCGSSVPSTTEFPMILEFDSGNVVTLEFHHYKEVTTGNWQWTTGATSNYPNSFPTAVAIGDSVKIKISLSGCSPIFSNTVFLAHPVTTKYGLHTELKCENVVVMNDLSQVPYGTDTFFYAIPDTFITWIGQAQNADSFFRWEKYNHTTGLFEEIPNSSNDTLFVKADYCDQGIYRAKIRLSLDFNPSDCRWVSSCGSDTLGIGTDLWARDGLADIGTEPNPDSTRDFWNSPDLWNCWTTSNCSVHESPEFMNSGWNYVHNTLRNKGSYVSDSFNVYLYWTLGGFYEKWPLSWHYDLTNNGFYNANHGLTYPMGSEIGIAGVSHLNPGTSKTITYQWSPPHPSWYDTSTYYNADRVVHPLCLLSRIVACEEDPYGMTFPEIEPTGDNVINNNNIVTRNTEVYDSIGTNKKTPVFVLRMGNQVNVPRKIRVSADNPVANFWDLGYYTLRLSSNLMNAWVLSGGYGNGYTLNGDVFTIGADGFYLDNINLDGGEWGWAYFQFHLHPWITISEDRGEQLFRFVQFSGDSAAPIYLPDGGFNFLLKLKPEVFIPEDLTIVEPDKREKKATEHGNAEVFWYQETENESSTKTTKTGVTTTSVIAYPNPSSGMVYFGLTLEAERTIGIEIFNSLGALVGEIKTRTYTEGKHKVSFDAGRLAPGTYLAKVNVNGEVKLISLVIVR